MSDTPERPEPASSTSAENPAPAESPAPGPPPAPQAESAARNAEPASAAPEPPASAAAVPEPPPAEAPAPEPPASAAAPPAAPAAATGDAEPAAAPPAAPAAATGDAEPAAAPPAAPAAATGDAEPAAAPDLATPATAPPAPSALPVPAAAPSPLPVPAAAPDRAAPPPRPPSSFLERVKRVFNFETGVYPEVAGDGLATLEAIMVVVLSSLLAGSFWNLTLIFFLTVPFALVMTAVSAVLVSAAAKLFNRESPGFAPWFRALGFAQAPLALGLIPLLGSFVGLVYWIAASIAAIHRVARVPVGQAILTWVLALMLPLLFLLFLALLFGGLAVLGTLAGGMA